MKITHLAVLATFVAAPLVAQANPFIVFPQDPERETITAASYVRRPDWNREAEGFQEISFDYFRGVGDTGGGQAMARGFYHWAGDLDSATAEPYGVILRSADVNGAPDTTPAGVIIEVPNLSLPVGSGGNTGWIMTDVFATAAPLPLNATWFQGLYLPDNQAWPASDGHSIWSADTLTAGTPAVVGENARLGAPAVTWAATPAPATFTTEWTYIMGTLVDNPTLHIGGIDPNSTRTGGAAGTPSYGMAGMFPDISGTPRSDGLELRMQDNQLANGLAVFAGSLGWWPGGGLPLSYGGDLYLDISNMVLLGAAINTGGAATLPFTSPGSIAPTLMGLDVMFQGVWLDPVTLGGRMSNGQVTSL